MQQSYLLPVRIQAISPSPWLTKDIRGWGKGDDGKTYWLKDNKRGFYTPATEYFCFALAHLCGVPTPEFRFVLVEDEVCFGCVELPNSRRHESFLNAVAEGRERVRGFSRVFSRTFALDLVLGNVDRTIYNFIFYDGVSGLPEVAAIDFGLAWWSVGFPHETISDLQGSNTLKVAKIISRGVAFDLEEAMSVLTTIRGVGEGELSQYLNEIPEDFLPQRVRDATCQWWSTSRDAHLKNLELGIRNGDFLPIRTTDVLS